MKRFYSSFLSYLSRAPDKWKKWEANKIKYKRKRERERGEKGRMMWESKGQTDRIEFENAKTIRSKPWF